MSERSAQRSPNRLIHETSPYLLQHAYNPVDWYPWGPEALALAKELNKPILLSIGYSACHWCHVMERESFENEQIAALMNEHFICIKVDREERPDLDEIYMQATLALNGGHGGWPMTVFLTPEQEPFFAGTYFPPTDRWGRPGFASILTKLADLWRQDPQGIRRRARELTQQLRLATEASSPFAVGEAELETAASQFAEAFDPQFGGFGPAPKFPPATGLSFLLRHYHRTGDAHLLAMVTKTLDAMAAGGLYDHIGGGFARYSTDERWLVPHFEKMLYDNALLARTYLEAWQVTGKSRYRQVATETLDYILREMTSPEGGFYSSTDADSEGIEGKFYVWTPEEIRAAVLDDEAARQFCAYYDITPGGNWEHKSIPNTPESLEVVAARLAISPEELARTIERVKPLVYAARAKRTPPGLDDKIITAWNGLMISAMAEGARVLGNGRYFRAAEKAADFLLGTMVRSDGRLFRTYRAGTAQHEACLEDYAYLAEGLIDFYEAGGHQRYLNQAVRLAEQIVADFTDEQHGGFFTTSKNHEALILRLREGADGATPSGNAVAASVLARLACHFGRDDFHQAAIQAIRAHGRQIARHGRAFAKSLCVLDFLLRGPVELVLIGSPGEPNYEALRAAVNRCYVPNRVIAHYDPKGPEPEHPLIRDKALVNGKSALYLCRNFACQPPLTDPQAVEAALAMPPIGQEAAPARRALRKRTVGYATPEGTAAYASRLMALKGEAIRYGFTTLGSTGLITSRLGFGGYRIGLDDTEHREALLSALRGGINLIDTAANYADGDSERLIGSVLAELIAKGEVSREAVIIVSKIGYVQGQSLRRAEARERSGKPYPEMVKFADDLWHCLHPDFLADQLDLSLDRLELDTLDILLLHNVEYFLMDAARRGEQTRETLHQEFRRRLKAAFEYLERQVSAGRLRYYGVSSNTLPAHVKHPTAVSLSDLLELAKAAAHAVGQRDCHFRVVECQLNLLEPGACLTPNTGPDGGRTLLEHAQAEQIAVLVNRPLNAIPSDERGVIRLAELPIEEAATTFEAQREVVAELEDEYRRELAPTIPWSGQGSLPQTYFQWAQNLAQLRSRLQGLEQWEQFEAQILVPRLSQTLNAVTRTLPPSQAERWQQWQERYLPQLLALLKAMRQEAALKSRARSAAISKALEPFLPLARWGEPLSRKALWIAASTPGVTSVLTGMRRPAYVADALTILSWPPLPNVLPIYQALGCGLDSKPGLG
jgi:uncharacterized protein YyaL (SSP411 family)/aryl-alcohol dehydrogenase-like predicted oxidoreductase